MARPRRYRKKPIEIEAMFWQGPGHDTADILDWVGTWTDEFGVERLAFVPLAWPVPRLYVAANHDWIDLHPPCWIAKDPLGFYPIAHQVFEQSYEAVQ